MSSLSKWDDPLGRYAHNFIAAAEQLFKLLRSLSGQSETSKAELVAVRLEQQILTGHRLRKIVERYTKSVRGLGLNEMLVGDVAWSAVAGQVKAGLGGYLQQLRLDILCAAAVLSGQRPESAEQLVTDTAATLQTMNCEVQLLINEVARPLLEKAEISISMAVDVSAFAARAAGGGSVTSGSSVAATPAAHNQNLSSRRSGQSAHTTTTHTAGGGDGNMNIVTLSASCPEYLAALRDTADPVIAAMSVSCRGVERLHRVHIDLLRGLLSNTVLGLVRRHSLLVSAVRSIRDISSKYHRIVQGQGALRVIRESVLLSMSPNDGHPQHQQQQQPEPAGKLTEVDSVGRLLQETMATCNVVRESCGLLRQWIVPQEQANSPPSRHAFDNPSAQKTATANAHKRMNGQYLLQTLKGLSSLLRRVAAAAEKAVTAFSEPALNNFSKILEIHSAPLLQCARVIANAQTDLKNLAPLCREKAQNVEQARDIEDTLAVLTASSSGGGGGGGGGSSEIVFNSFEHRVKETENLARAIFSLAARSTTVLQEVVTSSCRPIASGSQHLPFQYIDSEIGLLSQSMSQLCNQHDSIVANLKATTTGNSSANLEAIPSAVVGGGGGGGATLSLHEITAISAQRMSESEQRAIASSCSFDRLRAMCDTVDVACDKWFRQVAAASSSSTELDQRLDDEQMQTVAPAALLPKGAKDSDRRFTMQVLRGTLEHLEAGQDKVLEAPRPDRVSSPSALNDFEDHFSVAFVGVEGLCEQVFSPGATAGPTISIASASSLDVLAKIGAAASPQQAARVAGGGAVAGRARSPSESSAGDVSVMRGRQSQTAGSRYGGGASVTSSAYQQQRPRGESAANLMMRTVGSNSSMTGMSPLQSMSFPNTPNHASNNNASSNASPGLKMRSFTSKAAEAMPEHEMVPHELY